MAFLHSSPDVLLTGETHLTIRLPQEHLPPPVGVEIQAFNSSTLETETARSLWVQAQPSLEREFWDNQDSLTEKPYLGKPEE